MNVKNRILTVNILVIFVTVLTLLTGVFSVVMKMFSTKDEKIRNISVAADSTINFKKEGLLDLVGDGKFVAVSNPINIENAEQAIEAYNRYLNDYFKSGKVKANSSTLVVGGGSFMGISEYYAGIFNEEIYYREDGAFINNSVYCKIPNAEGKDDGAFAPDNYIEQLEIIDGVKTVRRSAGGKEVCSYIYENGRYKIVVNKSTFDSESQSETQEESNLIPFEVNNETVSGCTIDSSSSFIIKVKFNIKDSALKKYKESIRISDPNNKANPTFNTLNFEVTFNKYTGEIIEISKHEEYTLSNKTTVELTRSSQTVFKKED